MSKVDLPDGISFYLERSNEYADIEILGLFCATLSLWMDGPAWVVFPWKAEGPDGEEIKCRLSFSHTGVIVT
jgi:hypothetical protein